jgi:PAS domain S-box-containing protein
VTKLYESAVASSAAPLSAPHTDARSANSHDRDEVLRCVVESVPYPAVIIDQTGVIEHANQRWIEYGGQVGPRSNWRTGIHQDDLGMAGQWPESRPRGAALEMRLRWRGTDAVYRRHLFRMMLIIIADPDDPLAIATAINIEEQSQLELQLRDTEERLSLAMSGRGLGLWEADLISGAEIWSEGLAEIVGQRDSGGSLSWIRLIAPDDLNGIACAIDLARQNRSSFSSEFRIVKPGEIKPIWLSAFGRFSYDAQGRVVKFTGTVRDITERQRAQAQIREDELRWSKLVGSPLFGVVITNEERVLDANQLYLDMIGYSMEELRAGKVLRANLTPPEYKWLDQRGLAELRVTGSSLPYEKEYVRRDGSRVPVLLGSTTLTHEPLTWIGFVVDLTEQKHTERALRESEEQLRALTQASPVFLFTMTPEGRYSYASRYFYEFTGQGSDAVLGSGWLQALHPDDVSKVRETWQSCLATGDPYENEYRLRRADGVYRWFKARAIAVRDESRKITAWYGGAVDIHQQKEVQAEILAADRRKGEFLAILAHELRNPLAPINNAVEVLKRISPNDSPLRELYMIVDRQLQHLTHILDDLLDVTRISTGKIQLRKAPVNIRSVVEQALQTTKQLLETRGHQLELAMPQYRLLVNGDQVRLTQVLVNLLNNAAKYTPHGGSLVLQVTQEHDQAVIRVRDNGAGIDPALLNNIFDLFTQAQAVAGQEGLGIGLAIVRQLVELHGGRAEAHSEGLGRGSEFVVRLPLLEQSELSATDSAPAIEVRPSGEEQRSRVLIVDDNLDHVETLTTLLDLEGFEVRSAPDGKAALEKLREFDAQIILLDINMPILDGYSVARKIRELPDGPDKKLIAITGYGQNVDRERTADAGFSHHLVKPINFDQLLKLCRSGASENQPA